MNNIAYYATDNDNCTCNSQWCERLKSGFYLKNVR